jgi:hypothetical protein
MVGMPPDYSSMYYKLDRAEALLNGLNAKVDAWFATKPYRLRTEHNADFTDYGFFVDVIGSPDIVRWSLIYADFVHNLRCALDHMVWAIAVHENPAVAASNDRSLMFPIWNNPPSRDRRRIHRLNKPVRDAVEFVQPCNRVVTAPMHPLALLGYLDNMNKHQLLYLATATVAATQMRLAFGRLPGEVDPIHRVYSGQIKDGAEIMGVTFSHPHPEAKMYYDATFIIAIRYPTPGSGGIDRDDYAALGTHMIREVVGVIGAVTSAVV